MTRGAVSPPGGTTSAVCRGWPDEGSTILLKPGVQFPGFQSLLSLLARRLIPLCSFSPVHQLRGARDLGRGESDHALREGYAGKRLTNRQTGWNRKRSGPPYLKPPQVDTMLSGDYRSK